jgi:aspartyl-tRNA(Asn)/glutamyl-tRNA(Gln) amidotransferase subunit A
LRKSFDTVGLLTKTAEDAQLILAALAGEAGQQDDAPTIDHLRVGVARKFFFGNLEPDVARCIDEALGVFQSLVVSMSEVAIEIDVKWTDFDVEILEYHHQMLAETPQLYQLGTLARLKTCSAISPEAFERAQRGLAATRDEARKTFDAVDVVLTPTCLSAAPMVSDLQAMADKDLRAYEVQRLLGNTAPFSLLFWPSVSVPCGFTGEGLPVGLQISARPGADGLVLQVARAYEEVTDWHARAPAMET